MTAAVSGAGAPTDGSVRVKVHPALCTGTGECHRWAPRVYSLGEDGCIDIHLLEVPSELAEDAWLGSTVCPSQAITLIGRPHAHGIHHSPPPGPLPPDLHHDTENGHPSA